MAKTATRLIVGISGRLGHDLWRAAAGNAAQGRDRDPPVMSKSAEMTLVYETDLKPKDVRALASVHYPATDIGAAISSGSFPTMA